MGAHVERLWPELHDLHVTLKDMTSQRHEVRVAVPTARAAVPRDIAALVDALVIFEKRGGTVPWSS